LAGPAQGSRLSHAIHDKFGAKVTSAALGSATNLYLVVSDVERAQSRAA
jgi:signal transduction histidine kinase